jgi:hypothetical protein
VTITPLQQVSTGAVERCQNTKRFRIQVYLDDAICLPYSATLAIKSCLRHSFVTMSKLQPIFKLRVKIDGQEFEAEGPAELVRGQFEAFRAMMQETRRRAGAGLLRQNGNDVPAQEIETRKMDAPTHREGLVDLFRVAASPRALSLRQLPAGKTPEADAALLLLFGYQRLRNEDDVPATTLNAALAQSGCRTIRLDRILKAYLNDRSIVRTGRGKGGRYRLTNLGLHKAEDLMTIVSIAVAGQ